jgi:hypothetical protein
LQRSSTFARVLASNNSADASASEHLLATYLYAHARNFVANVVEVHSALKSSGTSPNFLITVASLKSPVAGSPERLNVTAPTLPAFRERASARITT